MIGEVGRPYHPPTHARMSRTRWSSTVAGRVRASRRARPPARASLSRAALFGAWEGRVRRGAARLLMAGLGRHVCRYVHNFNNFIYNASHHICSPRAGRCTVRAADGIAIRDRQVAPPPNPKRGVCERACRGTRWI